MNHDQLCWICNECCCELCGGGQTEIQRVLSADGDEEEYTEYTCFRCLSSNTIEFEDWFDLDGERTHGDEEE